MSLQGSVPVIAGSTLSGTTVETGDVEQSKNQSGAGCPTEDDVSQTGSTPPPATSSAPVVDPVAEDEDKETGKASINIPIQSKQIVTDALDLIGKLLAK